MTYGPLNLRTKEEEEGLAMISGRDRGRDTQETARQEGL